MASLRLALLSRPIAFRSIRRRLLSGPAESSTLSHRKGILPMYALTFCSSECSANLMSRGALVILPHVVANWEKEAS